ncbi:APH(3'') family aminoglycoside O-phosphotransferase [Streptomyces rimosus]|uniref:APH(3'') family aminoglycoside O-phosphotransferase n=1 Tax=Streptomyces rimosus TaxID=1927 RepID=UPI00067A9BAE
MSTVIDSTAFLTLLRADGGDAGWEPVTDGESGAAVFRSADGSRYAKCVPADQVAALEAERDRVSWLSTQDIPGPRVLDWRVGAAGAGLLTSAVEGIPADRASASMLRAAWEPIADAVRRLHELPPEKCPFTRELGEMFSMARDVVAREAVNPDFLPEEQRHTPPGELLARLAPYVGQRLAQEAAQTVVCHGDLCLPNIILDPDTLDVAGFIDLGRLGRADPYADLALLFATARETWGDDERWSQSAEEEFAARYGIALDRDRERFYLHLDPLTWG